jgi:hypothetical protein
MGFPRDAVLATRFRKETMTAFEGSCAERSALEADLEAARSRAARMLQSGHVVGAGRFLRTLPAELRGAPVLYVLRATVQERVRQVARRFDAGCECLVVEPRAGDCSSETHESLALCGSGHCVKDHVAALRSTGYDADEARALIVSWLERGLIMLATPGGRLDDRVRAAPGMGLASPAGVAEQPVAAAAERFGSGPTPPRVSSAPKATPRWWKPRTEIEPGPGGR